MTSIARSPAHGIPVTWLFTPGTDARHFDVAAQVDAGVAILDLEDAVAPDYKDRARGLVVERSLALRHDATGPRGAVRINSPGTLAGLRDLQAIAENRVAPDYMIIPKVDAAGTIELVADVLADADVATSLVVMIESASAAVELVKILEDARAPIAALMFGAADMAGDLAAEPDATVLAHARAAVLLAAAATGVPVIDSPHFDVHDTSGHAGAIADAVRNGFAAKAAIHPGQVAAITAGFTPSDAQINWATAVVGTAAHGVGTVDGQMIDEAIARRARRILARAGR